MDTPILFSLSNIRVFDHLKGYQDIKKGFGYLAKTLFGSAASVLHGFDATPQEPASLTINLTEGLIYALAPLESTPYGSLPADSTQIFQQGYAPASTVTLNTAGISPGQSKWALIECRFSQVNEVRSDDPTDGVLAFYNSSNPSDPLQGPGGSGQDLPTVRKGAAVVQVSYGSAAASGSAEPPPVSSGFVPMYLVLLTNGQTTITGGQILRSGPDAHEDAQVAPFAGGLYSHRHNGATGQAQKIDVTQEITGIVPFTNLLMTSAYSEEDYPAKISNLRTGTVNPNGVLAGGKGDTYIQEGANVIWFCSTPGVTAGATVWSPSGPITPTIINTFPATITQTSGTVLLSLSSDQSIPIPDATLACLLEIRRIDTNSTVKATLTPVGGQKIETADDKVLLVGDVVRMQSVPSLSKWIILSEYSLGV